MFLNIHKTTQEIFLFWKAWDKYQEKRQQLGTSYVSTLKEKQLTTDRFYELQNPYLWTSSYEIYVMHSPK